MTPIQPRRKPVQRLHPGLVGLPPEPEDIRTPVAPTSAPVETPKPVVAKRGRPSKGERPMTPAERKRIQRAKAEGPERDKLWAAIEKRIKTSENADVGEGLCTIKGCKDASHRHVKNVKENLPEMRAQFMTMPIDEARAVAESYELTWDSTGRKSFEGMTGNNDGEKLARMAGRPSKSIGGRRNLGAGPTSYDKPDMTADPADTKTYGRAFGTARFNYQWSQQERQRGFVEATEQLFEGAESAPRAEHDPEGLAPQLSLTCQVCGFRAEWWPQALAHIESEYAYAQKQLEFCGKLRTQVDDGVLPESFYLEARSKINEHIRFITLVLESEGIS